VRIDREWGSQGYNRVHRFTEGETSRASQPTNRGSGEAGEKVSGSVHAQYYTFLRRRPIIFRLLKTKFSHILS
jgi:hypothetical protein